MNKYIYLNKYLNDKVFFQLEDSLHIYKGIVKGGKIDLFSPINTTYNVEVTDILFNKEDDVQKVILNGCPLENNIFELEKPNLSVGMSVEIDIKDTVSFISEFLKPNTKIRNKDKESEYLVHYYELGCTHYNLSLRHFEKFKDLSINLKKDYNKIISDFHTINRLEKIFFPEYPLLKKTFFRFKDSYTFKPQKKVYVISEGQIEIKSIMKVLIDFKDFDFEKSIDDSLHYIRLFDNNKITFGLVNKKKQYQEYTYDKIYSTKKELISYISTIPNVK